MHLHEIPASVYFFLVGVNFLLSLIILFKSKSNFRYALIYLYSLLTITEYSPVILELNPNLWVYNLSLPFQFAGFGLLFYIHFAKVAAFRMIFWISISLILTFSLLDYLFLQGKEVINDYPLLLSGPLLMAFSLFYFWNELRSEIIKPIITEPMLWFCLGCLVIGAVCLPVGLFNYLLKKAIKDTQEILIPLWNFMNCIGHGLIMVGILLLLLSRYPSKVDVN